MVPLDEVVVIATTLFKTLLMPVQRSGYIFKGGTCTSVRNSFPPISARISSERKEFAPGANTLEETSFPNCEYLQKRDSQKKSEELFSLGKGGMNISEIVASVSIQCKTW